MPKSYVPCSHQPSFRALCAGAAKATTFDVDIVHSHIAFFMTILVSRKSLAPPTTFPALRVRRRKAGIKHPQRDRQGREPVDEQQAARRDIQGADWFNATEFPDITFVGKDFKKVDDKTGTIAGDLTIAGITKPTTLNVTFNKEGQNPWDKSHVVGFSARTTVKRSDFGMKAALGMIGDDVDSTSKWRAGAARSFANRGPAARVLPGAGGLLRG